MSKEQNPELKAISQKRIQELINEYANGSQQEFADATGVAKASVSQYVNKTNAPGNITAAKIGRRYNINPLWIMGFPVEKNVMDNSAVIDLPEKVKNIVLSASEIDIIEKLRTLDDYGHDMVTTVLEMEFARCKDENENTIVLDREIILSIPFEKRIKYEEYLNGNFELRAARKNHK